VRAWAAAVPLALLAGCSTTVSGAPVGPDDAGLVRAYFTALDNAADRGPEAQMSFWRTTQHPDFTDLLCDLQGTTVDADPSMTTMREDQTWAPQGRSRPRGTVYVVAVLLSVRKNGQAMGQQTGSERIVVLDGSAYGFMPCLR
jgi:hypothetical protein